MSPSREAGSERGRRRSSARGQSTPKTGPQWWVERWQRWMEEMGVASDSTSSRPLGRLKRLEVGHSQVSAIVQDRNNATCRLEIRIASWSDAQWVAALDAIAAQHAYTAQFAAGELPIELDALLEEAGAPLLPVQRDEIEIVCLEGVCSPDTCRHAALVFAQLGEALVDDPWMLLRMRGRDQTQLLAELRKPRKSAGESAEETLSGSTGSTADSLSDNISSTSTESNAASKSAASSTVTANTPGTAVSGADTVSSPPMRSEAMRSEASEARGVKSMGEETAGTTVDYSESYPSSTISAHSTSTSSTLASSGGRFHRNPSESGAQEDVPSLNDQIGQFWGVSKALEGYRPILAEPKVGAVLLRRLGPLPLSSSADSADDSADDIYDELAAVYRRVTREALRRAFASDSEQDSKQDSE